MQEDQAGLMLHEWPGLLIAFAFGLRADKHGRKPVLLLSFTGELLALVWVVTICKTLPPRLVPRYDCDSPTGNQKLTFNKAIFTSCSQLSSYGFRRCSYFWEAEVEFFFPWSTLCSQMPLIKAIGKWTVLSRRQLDMDY